MTQGPALPIPPGVSRRHVLIWDAAAILLVLGTLVFLADVSRAVVQPLPEAGGVTLDPWSLPEYAMRTTFRMLAAMALSLVFTFTYATLAAKSRRAEAVLIPLLDILQSVPVLGFISVTIVFFMALAPGRVLGAEFAAIFAIFTSQAWNMAFSFYQSLRTVPDELNEVSRCFRFGAWMRFWRVEVPFAIPQLVWNMMVSMSGGWFFVVAAEAITVGDATVTLPGIGSYIALAIERRDLLAIGWAIAAMAVVILVYDQLLFRPLVAWADRFRFQQEAGMAHPRSWVLTLLRRSRLVGWAARPLARPLQRAQLPWRPLREPTGQGGAPHVPSRWMDFAWHAAVAALIGLAVWKSAVFIAEGVSPGELPGVLLLGLATLARVLLLILLACAIWIPVGVYIGLRPALSRSVQPAAQFLAAFPANLLFPVAVWGIVTFRLEPNIWLSPLMILGTQWYILFNVVAGASAIPSELRDIAANFNIRGWLWWRRVALPAVFPFAVTGAITASGGAWNASVVAEVATWGNERLQAKGIGAYIAQATEAGDYHRIVLGIAVMSAFVIVINRAFWRPLYHYAERRFRLG